jgi:hypothetical protein
MRICPTCRRAYEDDTFTFCLDDGSRLSAVHEHPSRTPGKARVTELPKTEIMPGLAGADTEPTVLRPTLPSFTPLSSPHQAKPPQAIKKRHAKRWIILSGTLACIVLGLAGTLVFVLWRASQLSASEPVIVSSPSKTNTSLPTAEPSGTQPAESKLTKASSSEWLDGVWDGRGYQSNTKTNWALTLAAQNGSYAIDYPSIPCRGKWTLVNQNAAEARFVEVITTGLGRCANNGNVMIRKISDSQISLRFTYAHSKVVIATATLTRRGSSTQ